MNIPITHIAALIEAKIEGDASITLNSVSKIEEGKEGSITFLANPKYTEYIYTTNASAVIVKEDFLPKKKISATLLRVKDPYKAFTVLLEKSEELLAVKHEGIEKPSFIAENAQIQEGVYVGAFSYIGKNAKIGKNTQIYPQVYIGDEVEVGANTIIYPGAKIYKGCKIGNDCIIHAGSCIGSDGFGFAPQGDGTYKKIPQIGIVVIEDFVEVGANSTIDRATLGETRIKQGVKIDNLVQIAHNVEVGEGTVIAAQTGIAGSTTIGKNCILGGQVGLVGHIQIADEAKIDAQSGVAKSISEKASAWRGSPAQPFRNQLKSEIVFRNLSRLQKEVQQIQRDFKLLQESK